MSFFKAYDMRGVFGTDFSLEDVYRIGRWLPPVLGAKRMLVGRDARESSEAIRDALCRGLSESGCDVDDAGLATTPMVYFFTASKGYDASVQITASHNPPAHNGMKVSRAGAVPVGYDSGLADVEAHLASGTLPPPGTKAGVVRTVDYRDEFVRWLCDYRRRMVDLSGLRLAVDCSDGVSGLVARAVLGESHLYLNEVPDGRFPHHAPNPLEPENRGQLVRAVRENGCDAGVIFDGDGDRVMFVDENGAFIQPDYLIPVIAHAFLAREPGATVIHDIRTSRGAIEALRADGAQTVMVRVGHAFAKVALRETGAVCGGELAGHYYFRDFVCCDSGELAAVLVLGALAAAKRRGQTFGGLVRPICRYANSGEMNFRIGNKDGAIAAVLASLEPFGPPLARYSFDGERIEFADWWLNVRKSNTEPYLRLIVEARDAASLAARVDALRRTLEPFCEARASGGAE